MVLTKVTHSQTVKSSIFISIDFGYCDCVTVAKLIEMKIITDFGIS